MRRRIALAALAIAVLVVPATVIAASQGRFAANINGMEMHWNDGPVTTNRTSFETLFGGEFATSAGAVTVSADIARGKARFRVVSRDQGTNAPYEVHPGGVTFGRGAQSYTFALPVPGAGTHHKYRVQWKRVGEQEVRARSLTAAYVGQPD